jgi:ankyrin repeat protein
MAAINAVWPPEVKKQAIRFCIPVIASIALTPIFVFICIAFAGGGHGTVFPMWILFPFWWLMFSDGLAHSNFVLFPPLLVQFPIYGIILGFANVKRKLILAACVLLCIHLSATGWIFGSYYYGIYKSKHDPNNQLEKAVRNNDVETARSLLDQGIDPNYHQQYRPTLLFLACIDGHREMAKLLLDKGADINYSDPHDGETAIFVAVVFHREEVVQLLLSKGADLTVKGRDGFTVLERAKKRRESRETSLKRTKREPEIIAEELQPDDRIISLLEAATKNQKKR